MVVTVQCHLYPRKIGGGVPKAQRHNSSPVSRRRLTWVWSLICLAMFAYISMQPFELSKIHPFPTRQSLGTRLLPPRALKVSRNFGRADTFIPDNLFECSICLFPIILNLASLVLECFSRWCKFLIGKSPLETQAPEFPSSESSLQECQTDSRFSHFSLACWNPATETSFFLREASFWMWV